MKFIKILLLLPVLFMTGCRFQSNGKPEEAASSYQEEAGITLESKTPLLITPEALNVLPVAGITQQPARATDNEVVRYPFFIREEIDFSTLKIAIQSDINSEIRINNRKLAPIPSTYFLTENFRMYEIGPFVNPGINTVQWYLPAHEKERDKNAFILGVFGLYPATGRYEIGRPVPLRLGDWSKQGMFFYPDAVSYSKIYVLPENKYTYVLSLPEWKGNRSVVYINKKQASEITEQAALLDVTSYLDAGENIVDVRIFGYTENTMVPFRHPEALAGDSLGTLYCKPVGLFRDFILKRH